MRKALKVLKDGIHVFIDQQRLYVLMDGKMTHNFLVSTSKKTPSCQQNSEGTPWGQHIICEKIGDGQPLGMVFKGRVPIGKKYWECDNNDIETLITSRILRLQGQEPGVNSGEGCDSFERYIYIHGTNKEDKVGEPASKGCINLCNEDMIELFNAVEVGVSVWIYPHHA